MSSGEGEPMDNENVLEAENTNGECSGTVAPETEAFCADDEGGVDDASHAETEPDSEAEPAPVDFLFDGAGESGLFIDSVVAITADEMGGAITKKRFSVSTFVSYLFEKLVLLLALGVFIYCSVELVIIFTEQYSGDRYYEELLDGYTSILDSGSVGAYTMSKMQSSDAFVAGVSQPDNGIVIEMEQYDQEVELMKAKISALMHAYPDVYAYIVIEDTVIEYPVVRGDDNDFYLNHAFTGEPMSIGSVFADYRLNDYILDNYNTVFYAHNSSTGKMFADVMKFAQSEEFFNTHNIYVYTSTGKYVFEPFNLAIFRSDYQYFRTRFSSAASFVAFANEMQSQSMYSKRTTFDENDRIITLSTCTKLGIKNLRYCLQGKLIEVTE